MTRKPRQKSETGIYHVIARGIGQQNIFHEEGDFQRYLEILERLSVESGVSVLGYCLMSNHVHLLLRENGGDVSSFMKRLGIRYASWYNRKYERAGHVFQDRFKSEGVEDDAYLLAVIRYIHQNPVKALVSDRAEKYKWSSCAAYYKADRNISAFPDTSQILAIIHKDRKTAVKMFRKFSEEDNEDRCLDWDGTRRIGESEARDIARTVMEGKPVTALQTMDTETRRKILSRLRNEGLSLRQISRITGLPFHIVRKP